MTGHNEVNSNITLHVGDALASSACVEASSACVEGGFSALIVDLFSGGKVLDALMDVKTWQSFKAKLRPDGRIIANLGSVMGDALSGQTDAHTAGASAFKAMQEVFPEGHLFYMKEKNNTVIITGSSPVTVWEKFFLENQDEKLAELEPLSVNWVPFPAA